MSTPITPVILMGESGKELIKSLKKRRNQKFPDLKGTKGYYRVAPRNYTAFRINENGILRIYESIQHEGDCRTRLKLGQL